MKNLKIKPLVIALAAVCAGMAGCGGTDQDKGTVSKVAVSGLGIDGYLARSEVFQDMNSNNVRDAFEPRAYTDDQGYYSYNAESNVNYCSASTAAALREKHCLMAVPGNYPVVIQGGYDLLTGEPFKGMLRKYVDVQTSRLPTQLDFVSPVSTLLSFVPQDSASQLSMKGLILGSYFEESMLSRDFYNRGADALDQETDDATDLQLVALTQKIHKTISTASQLADLTYKVKDEAKLPADTSLYIYKSFADLMINSQANVSQVIQNNLNTVMTTAKANIEQAYASQNITLPNTTGLPSTIINTTALTNLPKVSTIVDGLVSRLTSIQPDQDDVLAATKMIELTMTKIVKNNNATDINNIVTAVQNTNTVNTLNTAISKPGTTISSLINVNLSNQTDVNNATNITYSGELAQLAGKRLPVSDSTVSGNVRDSKDYSAILYFAADSDNATSGTLTACIRYVNGLNANYTLKSGATLGTQSDIGSWAVLNGGYAMMLDFEIAGASRQATIQFGGPNPNYQGHYIYRTDIDEELKTWSGPGVPQTYTGNIPATDAECETELNSLDPMNSALANAIVRS